MRASKKEIINQAEYICVLANRIKDSAKNQKHDDSHSQERGTITNLAPELAKAASQIKKMNTWGWNDY